jgi:hypothetical protein
MKNKIICALAIFLFLMVVSTAVHAEEQEIIDEDELETKFAEDSEALLASLEANTTVVVPVPDEHECRFAILWKKVRYKNGQPVSGATVTISSDYDGTKIRIGFLQWVDPPITKTTNRRGSVCFIILWNSHPPESIVVTIAVSKDGYAHTEEVRLMGKPCCYEFKCIRNEIPPPPSAPELALTTPIVTSIGAAAYFWFRRKHEKQSI